MAQLTIVFVPGAFHTAEYYDPVRALLETNGYPTTAVALPSIGSTSSMADDAAAIRAVTSNLADEGRRIVLVMHSYGGIPGTESAKDLGWNVRQKEGKPGGIIALVYVAAYFVKKGISVMSAWWKEEIPPFLSFKDGLVIYEKTAALANFYDDVPPSLHPEDWISRLKPHSMASWEGELSYEAYRDIPTTYLFCTNDMSMPVEIQRKAVSDMENEITTVTCDSGHSPMLSMPGVVADVIVKAAGGEV
ncbi:Alpha/beta hydrolase fold-1 [Aspergillus pseudoustus]|uniref:Alpha/beta hydrolase fold-1 n=1 Tax=Aspergillus pseudoustus TaxID=1810923 RepID=A0ABR4KFI6_9EURO